MATKIDNNTVKVVAGDTLSQIALTYLGSASKYQYLADINNIPNPNLIRIGQIIKLSGSSSTSSNKTTTNSNIVTITNFGLSSTNEKELFATWDWGKESQTKSYKVLWEYCGENGVYVTATNSENTVDHDYRRASRYTSYTIPSGASTVRFKVKPISEPKKDSEGKEIGVHWTAEWTPWLNHTVDNPLEAPSTPSVEIDDKNKLTASIDNINTIATHVVFEIVKDDKTPVVTSKNVAIDKYKRVSYTYTVEAGHEYKVRAKVVKNKLDSDWSAFSSNVQSMPAAPSSITQCKAAGKESGTYSVYLEWSKVTSATAYIIEYTNNKSHFDNPTGDVTTVTTNDASTKITLLKLNPGEYFFRVKAKNGKGDSNPSEIKSLVLGTAPAAPTTWSSTATAIAGEPMTLYWVHNSEDSSSQSWAQLRLAIGGTVTTYEIKNDGRYMIDSFGALKKISDFEDEETEKDQTSYCIVETSGYREGAMVEWDVCTAGLIKEFGDWSVKRTFDVYSKPTLDLYVTNKFSIDEDGVITLIDPDGGKMSTLTSFPFYVKATPGYSTTQHPISYHLTVTANSAYETVDELGNDKVVSAGEMVYSKVFDISEVLLVEFSAGNIDLENGVDYTITCTVAMSSGLTASAYKSFDVSWSEVYYEPNAEIMIDNDTFSASIRPYCEERNLVYRRVVNSSGVYSVTDETIDEATMATVENVYTNNGDRVLLGTIEKMPGDRYCIAYVDNVGNPIDATHYSVSKVDSSYIRYRKTTASSVTPIKTATGEEVLLGVLPNDEEILYCSYEEVNLVNDITLAVYRREFDGGFTEIASGLSNADNTFVTDPHPALDYARYRIVATTNSTGAVSYFDIPGYYVGGKAVVIQWDEAWSSFNQWSEEPLSEPTWSGSILKLPYNIDVSDNNSPDVAHVKYIGRKRPVSYYGTQLGESSSWNVTIEKSDKETIYALRRLAQWMGDVYVREPSGTGYWANIKVSFGHKHKDVTIPVSFDITRVEGGI